MRRREGGMVLVVTLAILSALVAIVATIAANQRVESKARINRGQERRARLAAEAGIQRGIAELQLYSQTGQTNISSLADDWATVGTQGSEGFALGANSFRLQIVDASSLIDINTAPEEQLAKLPLTTEQIDTLLDWRSPEMQPRPQGAKDEYYNGLENPYNAKLRRFDSIDELLLVKGFTAPTVYEPQTDVQTTAQPLLGPNGEALALADVSCVEAQSANTSPSGQPKLNVNTVSVQQMIQRGVPANVATAIVQRRNTQGTFTRLGDVLAVNGVNQQNAGTIIDNLWINASAVVEGRINVNTASEAVLNSIPGIEPDMAAAIVGRQTTAMQSVSELLTVPGITLQVLQQSVDRLTVSTQTFLVRVIGKAGDTSVPLQATVQLDQNGLRLLKVERMPFDDTWRRWGWGQDTTTETVVSDN